MESCVASTETMSFIKIKKQVDVFVCEEKEETS